MERTYPPKIDPHRHRLPAEISPPKRTPAAITTGKKKKGSGVLGCQDLSNVMCMSGEVFGKGFLAGSLYACIYSGPGCTGDSAGFDDCSDCGWPVSLWTKSTGFESAVSWQVKEGDR